MHRHLFGANAGGWRPFHFWLLAYLVAMWPHSRSNVHRIPPRLVSWDSMWTTSRRGPRLTLRLIVPFVLAGAWAVAVMHLVGHAERLPAVGTADKLWLYHADLSRLQGPQKMGLYARCLTLCFQTFFKIRTRPKAPPAFLPKAFHAPYFRSCSA